MKNIVSVGGDGGDRRLVIVSNRVALPDEHGSLPPGGMAIALNAALKQRGGLWMGWSGKVKAEKKQVSPTMQEANGITYALADLSEKDLDEYYYGFANRVLWPVFHCRVDLAEYTDARKSGYYRVNRLFAESLMPLHREDDTIWVQDYHLIPLGKELRERGCRNRIGFFLHIPWPPADILATVPLCEELLEALSFYDLVGFQTDDDLNNFAECLSRRNLGRLMKDGSCLVKGRQFRCGVFPIGIDTAKFESLAKLATRDGDLQEVYKKIAGCDVAIGVDRLDYSKGIDQRIVAFRHFLDRNSHRVRKTLLLQITPKSRGEIPAYLALQKHIAELVGSVNGELGTIDWVPVHYTNRSHGPLELAGLYRMARVGLVTPLRDGMNLVAKEYVAAQDPSNPGVLVLSQFAGAAGQLEGAMLVNPYDPEAVAASTEKAFRMSPEERKDRWSAMKNSLKGHDVYRWCGGFLAKLEAADLPV
ncbi:MAG: trehalose-6-phosphate synthase [Mesorhizobium sp.]|uniref:alpha,alpha-trehalose-phosphate synthase (UDP-forming) n=1 Tax=Mesorhizobium sp. TaxID=1871066 RepID=UPI000FEA6E17|nr:trehalose-6-phosphate synthase [Mesorhizobium sp.]RWO03340.1 MAG: trehalose-6-phosphate synthase [Mesorhizobium sp.]RWP94076.1 MAG: trehalose-6-phosphate synthase [Mesorhizobium sp.]